MNQIRIDYDNEKLLIQNEFSKLKEERDQF